MFTPLLSLLLAKLLRFCFFLLRAALEEPLDVAEVLPVGQEGVFGEHAVGELEGAGVVDGRADLEGVEVAFAAYDVHGDDFVDGLGVVVGGDDDELEAYGVVEAGLVDDVGDGELGSALEGGAGEVFAALGADDADGVPALGDELLPGGELAGALRAVGGEEVVALCLGGVELVVVVVELALHGVVGGYLGDGVLDGAYPVFAVAAAVARVVEGYDFLLEHGVDGGGVEAVLVFLVLVGALLGEGPSGAFAVAFEPPAVEHGEVDDAVHEGFFAGGA